MNIVAALFGSIVCLPARGHIVRLVVVVLGMILSHDRIGIGAVRHVVQVGVVFLIATVRRVAHKSIRYGLAQIYQTRRH